MQQAGTGPDCIKGGSVIQLVKAQLSDLQSSVLSCNAAHFLTAVGCCHIKAQGAEIQAVPAGSAAKVKDGHALVKTCSEPGIDV